MISAHDLGITVGSRTLMSGVSFRVDTGDRVGLVGRNGAGKTTLTRVLMSEVLPSEGTVTTSGTVGYLPQDPRAGDPKSTGRERILAPATSTSWPAGCGRRRSRCPRRTRLSWRRR